MRNLKIGILSFAHVHAASYATLLKNWEGVELLCSDPEGSGDPVGEVRGREFADELGVPYVDSYEELFAWNPDAVVICSENARHKDLAILAADHGCSVLCEKPLATSIEDGRAMVDACEGAGVFLMVAYPVRFSPQFTALKLAVDSGALGELLMASGTNNGQIPIASRSWFTDPELSGGGSLVDHVVHVADLMDSLLDGEQAVSVRAVSNQILHADKPQVRAETGGIVVVNYPGGLSVTIDCSWSQPDHAPTWGGLTLSVYGSRGNASIAPFDLRVDGFSEKKQSPLWLSFGEDFDKTMLETFIGALRSGETPQPDGAAGMRSLRIVEAAKRSAANGGTVEPV